MGTHPLGPLLFPILDALMLLASRGWLRADIQLQRIGGKLQMSELATAGDGTAVAPGRAPFRIDPQEEADRLAEGVEELCDTLDLAQTPAVLTFLRVREGDVAIRFVDANGTELWKESVEKAQAEALLVTDQILDMVAASEHAFEALQTAFRLEAGLVDGYTWDGSSLVLSSNADSPRVFPARKLGDFDLFEHRWHWAWAERRSSDDPLYRACDVQRTPPGLSALWRPAYHCDEGFIQGISSALVLTLGARGLFRALEANGRIARLWAVGAAS